MATLGQVFQWILCIIFLSTSCRAQEIEKCRYVDAYAIECWWRRPLNNSEATFSLTYKSLADPKPLNLVHECKPNKISINSKGEEVESCTVPGVSMYGSYRFTLLSVCQNEMANFTCTPNASTEISIYTNEQSAIIRTPPNNLRIEMSSRLLWDEPKRHGSMLSYVLKNNEINYKVMIKLLKKRDDANAILDDSWKEWNVGSKKDFIFPALLPRSLYVARVFVTAVKPGEELTWSNSSEPFTFNSSSVVIHKLPHLKTTPDTFVTEESAKPTSDFKRQLVLSITLPMVFVFLLSIFCYAVICVKCKFCSTKTKLPTPRVMITIAEMNSRDDYIQSDFETEREADVVLLPTQFLSFTQKTQNPGVKSRTSDSIRLFCQNERYVENGHQRSQTTTHDNTRTTEESPTERTILLQNGLPPLNLPNNGSTRNHVNKVFATGLCNGFAKLSHDNEIGNTVRLPTRKANTQDTAKHLNRDEVPHQPVEMPRLFSDVPYPVDGGKDYSHFDPSKLSEGSECMDYVMDSSLSPPIDGDVADEEYFLVKHLEEAKRARLLHSDSTEKIPDYVTQTTCFARNPPEQMVMFVTSPQSSTSGCFSKNTFCACASATEKMRHLLEHMQAEKICPFCKKNFPTLASSSDIERKEEDSGSYQGTRMGSLSSETSSLDSGYSPDTTTPT